MSNTAQKKAKPAQAKNSAIKNAVAFLISNTKTILVRAANCRRQIPAKHIFCRTKIKISKLAESNRRSQRQMHESKNCAHNATAKTANTKNFCASFYMLRDQICACSNHEMAKIFFCVRYLDFPHLALAKRVKNKSALFGALFQILVFRLGAPLAPNRKGQRHGAK